MIEVDGAGVAFGGRFVFRHLGWRLERGEILAILGRNGRGKTTLLRALLGLQRLTEGRIATAGSLGYVPQRTSTPFNFTVLEVVLTGRARHLSLFQNPGPEDRAKARASLATLGIADFEERRIEDLSGGERQLVFIARALAAESDVLVLDEPTSALDYRNQDLILSVLRDVARHKGLTVVFASHYPQHALLTADRVLLMDEADRAEFGATAEVMSEASLSALYDIPMRHLDGRDAGAHMVPVFLAGRGASR